MKKRSILLTCVAALMALAMFVGCDNAPVFPDMPTSVKSGYILQTGDFLTGQAFDPSKFDVYVTYDNSDTPVLVETTAVRMEAESDTTANSGDKVVALAGYNNEGAEVLARGAVTAYTINRVEIEKAPELVSVGGAAPVVGKSSDYTVRAYYYDSENVEKSMLLTSAEFTVSFDSWVDETPSAANPTADGYILVTTNVGGNGSFNVAVPVAFEAAVINIKSIDAVYIKTTTVLPAWTYDGVPVPSFNDVLVYVNGDKTTPLAADPGIELIYGTKNGGAFIPLDTDNLTGMTAAQLFVLATYEGQSVVSSYIDSNSRSYINPSAVTIGLKPSNNFKGFAAESEATVNPADFIVTATYANTAELLDSEDVEFVVSLNGYCDATNAEANALETIPESGSVFVYAIYRGNVGKIEVNVTAKVPAEVESVTGGKVAENALLPAKAYYHANNMASLKPSKDMIDSITVTMDDGTTETVTAKDSTTFTVDETAYYFAADEESAVKTENAEKIVVNGGNYYDVTADKLYVKVTYYGKVGFIEVNTETPEVKSLVAVPVYRNALNDSQKTPMVNSPIDWTVYTAAGSGNIIDPAFQDWAIVVDGTEVADKSTVRVTDEEQTYNIYTTFGGTGFMTISDPAKIPAGKSYIQKTGDRFIATVNYTPLYGQEISYDAEDYAVTGWSVEGSETDMAPAVEVVEPEGKDLLAAGNKVRLSVTYTDATGEEITEYVTTSEFISVANVTVPGTLSIADIEGRIENGKVLNGQSYNITEFVVDKEDYIPYGNITLEVESVEFGGKTTSTGSVTFVTSDTGLLTVNIKPFLNSSGELVDDAKITLNVVSSLE